MVTDTDPENPVNADMWRAIGRLEGATAALLEGQREIKASLHEQQQEFRTSLHEQQQEFRASLQGQQQEFRASLQEQQREFRVSLQELRTGLAAVNQRVDRLFYTILAVGGAVIAAVIASRFIGG